MDGTRMIAAASADPLEIAVQFLASVCDGAVSDDAAGFNGADAPFGHSLAGQAGRWSPKQRASARRLVQKYRKQVLSGTGIDVAVLPESPGAPSALAVLSDSRRTLGPDGPLARGFPGYEAREGQLQFAEAVEEAIRDGHHLVAECGTGTGKSFGYLVPAVGSGRRTIVSTADKALQDQLMQKDLPTLRDILPTPFRYALLKGRSNYVCLHRLNKLKAALVEPEFRRNQESSVAFDVLATWAEETRTGDLDSLHFALPNEVRSEVTVTSEECLGRKCPLFDMCFVEKAKALAADADVIVVNHALLMRDLAIRAGTAGHAHIIPDAPVCVVDEAHHTERVAADSLGVEVTLARWRRAARKMESLTIFHDEVRGNPDWQGDAGAIYGEKLAPVGDFLKSAFDAIADRMKSANMTTQRLGMEPMLSVAAGMLAAVAEDLLDRRPAWLASDDCTVWEKTVKALDKLARDLTDVATPADATYVRYAQIEGTGRYERLVLYAKPIDVAPVLDAILWTRHEYTETDDYGNARTFSYGFETVVCASATIADSAGFGHWRERVGLEEARELVAPSPFDYPNNAMLYLPSNGVTLDPSRGRGADTSAEYLDALAREVRALLLASRGRAFVLFASYRTLNEVYGRVAPAIAWRTLRQGDLPRPQLLREFKADRDSVLFATRSFWEGVDVVGEALSLVIIDKVPFAPPDDPLWEARKEAINRKRNDQWAWFGELAIPDATIALKQGVGRLIRSTTDRGVFAVLDARLVSKRYGKEIVGALPPAKVTRSLDDVRGFFA